MESLTYPRIIFPDGFDDRAAFEVTMKGWLSAEVETEDGRRYPVFFYDSVRLQQDLETEVKLGRPCLAETGLVILPEVTVEAAQNAMQYLWQQGFFAGFKPTQSELKKPVAA